MYRQNLAHTPGTDEGHLAGGTSGNTSGQTSNPLGGTGQRRAPRINHRHSEGYSDNHGLDIHGSELAFAEKTDVVMAAEACFGSNVDDELQTMLNSARSPSQDIFS